MFPGVKGGRCVGLTTLPFSCANCLEIWEPQIPGTLRACPGTLPFTNVRFFLPFIQWDLQSRIFWTAS